MIFLTSLRSIVGEAGKGRFLGIIFLIYTMVILIAGLWPFNFNPANKVAWVKNGNGIEFNGRGIVYSPEPMKLADTALKNGSITIEILIRAHQESNKSVPSIFTLLNNNQDRFIFCQWKKAFLIRVPNIKGESKYRFHEIGVANVLVKETTHLITVTSQQEITNINIDGKLMRSVPHYPLFTNDNWLTAHIILGNSPEGISSWNGSILGLAIYDQALTGKDIFDHHRIWLHRGQSLIAEKIKPIALYLFDEHGGEYIQDLSGYGNNLLMPSNFRPLRRIVLEVPSREYWFTYSDMMDIAINILGFIPFGFFLSSWLLKVKNLSTHCVFWITLFLGFCISFGIELAQIYLPGRDSSLLDLINNILGTAAGILFFNFSRIILHNKSRAETDASAERKYI